MKPYDPSAEIHLAVRCGFLSKELWNEFFAKGKPRWRRHVWTRFVSSGLFKTHYSKRATDVIIPNFDHPLVKRISGGEVTHAPNTAQIDHDEIIVKSFLALEKQQIIIGQLSLKLNSKEKIKGLYVTIICLRKINIQI